MFDWPDRTRWKSCRVWTCMTLVSSRITDPTIHLPPRGTGGAIEGSEPTPADCTAVTSRLHLWT